MKDRKCGGMPMTYAGELGSNEQFFDVTITHRSYLFCLSNNLRPTGTT